MENGRSSIKDRNLAVNIDEMEKAMIELEQNSGSNLMAIPDDNNTISPPARSNEWDETVVPAAAAGKSPPAESFVIPIDAPDGKLKSSNRQANTYAAKKTVAQGMMDIALITANANQLRYIVEYTSNSKTFYFNLFLITLSLLIQVGVGIALIFKGRLDLKGESKMAHARRINNYVVVGVFLVTIINVFIASFTITGSGNGNGFQVQAGSNPVPNGNNVNTMTNQI